MMIVTTSDNIEIICSAFFHFAEHFRSPIALFNSMMSVESEPIHPIDSNMDTETTTIVDKTHQIRSNPPQSHLYKLFANCLSQQDINIVKYLITLLHVLEVTISYHPTEAADLMDISRKLEIMLSEIFASNSFDEQTIVVRVLMPEIQNIPHLTQSDMLTHLFHEQSLLLYCLENGIRTLFDKPQVNNVVNYVFYEYFKAGEIIFVDEDGSDVDQTLYFALYNCSSSVAPLSIAYYVLVSTGKYSIMSKYTHCLRSKPIVIMIGEMLSKCFILWLAATIAIYDYATLLNLNYEYHIDDDTITSTSNYRNYSRYEILLVIMTIGDFFFEIGQTLDEMNQTQRKDKIQLTSIPELLAGWCANHFSTDWNLIDLICSIGLISWIILRFCCSTYFLSTARVVLTISAIPLSFGLLRYLSIYRPLGELVILIKGMTYEVFNFIIVYAFSILGFGITFYGLFYKTDNYAGVGYSFLTLLGNTLGNMDFSAFITTSETVNTIGIVLLIIFVVFTAIVLMNLLIAQMSNVYAEIKENAHREWSYMYSKLVEEYFVEHERHILSSLPAPLNLLMIPMFIIEIIMFRVWVTLFQRNHTSFVRIAWTNVFCNLLYSYLFGTWLRIGYMIKDIHTVTIERIYPTMAQSTKPIYHTAQCCLWYAIMIPICMLLEILFGPIYFLFQEFSYRNSKGILKKTYCYLDIINVNRLGFIVNHGELAKGDVVDNKDGGGNEQEMDKKQNDVSPQEHGDVDNNKKVILFSEADRMRILRPLIPNMKSLANDDLFRLESNLALESNRLCEKIVASNEISAETVNKALAVMKEDFNKLEKKVDALDQTLQEILSLLKK